MESLQEERAMLLDELERAYSQGADKWMGCDWPTRFGKCGLNLDGLTAPQALLLARATSGAERADWHAAVPWLTGIEQDASKAQREASQGMALARAGKLREALSHVQRACALEARHHSRLVWQPLYDVIEAHLSAAVS